VIGQTTEELAFRDRHRILCGVFVYLTHGVNYRDLGRPVLVISHCRKFEDH